MWPVARDSRSITGPQLIRRDRVPRMDAPHRHQPVEFNLVLAGTATYLLADRRYDLSAHSLVWLFPGQVHIMVQRSASYRDWLGLIPQDDLRPWCHSDRTRGLLDRDPPGHQARRLSPRAAHELDDVLGRVAGSSPETAAAGQAYAVLAAWDAFWAADLPPEPGRIRPAVRTAMRLLSSPGAPSDLASLAARLGLTPQHLSRVFLAETGIGITQFRNEQRLRAFVDAHRAQPDRPLLDLALAAGFGSAAQFHRVTRQLTGLTPAALVGRRGSAGPL